MRSGRDPIVDRVFRCNGFLELQGRPIQGKGADARGAMPSVNQEIEAIADRENGFCKGKIRLKGCEP
jgi:hypothetical protein